jgi:hypothetical protein
LVTQYAAALDCNENVQVIYVLKSETDHLDRGEIGYKMLLDNIVDSLTQFSSNINHIAGAEISAGQYRVFELQSLAHVVSVNDAYVILCKSRTGNEAFYI